MNKTRADRAALTGDVVVVDILLGKADCGKREGKNDRLSVHGKCAVLSVLTIEVEVVMKFC